MSAANSAKYVEVPFGLAPRQEQVADGLVRHGNSKLIARELGISVATVENTIAAVRFKLGVPNNVRAAVEWDRARRSA
jgi:DNA-binding CsgD family transcriptional regulator